MSIAQDVDAPGAKRARDLLRIALEIVVANHREYVQPRPQLAQRLRHRLDIGGGKRDVVARQRHHIGARLVCEVDGALDTFERGEEVVVEVRQVRDPQAVVGGRETTQPDVGFGDLGIRGDPRRRQLRLRTVQRERD